MTGLSRNEAAGPRDRKGAMIPALLAALPVATALPAVALEAACHFTVECFEDEPCDEADFVLRIRPGPEPMSVRLGGPVRAVRRACRS